MSFYDQLDGRLLGYRLITHHVGGHTLTLGFPLQQVRHRLRMPVEACLQHFKTGPAGGVLVIDDLAEPGVL